MRGRIRIGKNYLEEEKENRTRVYDYVDAEDLEDDAFSQQEYLGILYRSNRSSIFPPSFSLYLGFYNGVGFI